MSGSAAFPAPRAASFYLHVPFCARKCEYCAFYSTAADGALIERYVRALVLELTQRAPELATVPSTVFFGGGTPSLLTLRQWEVILDAFDRLGWRGATEWTVECNPATVSLDKARLLRSRGVNRISMGVQSLDERLLDRLGRVHSRDMVFRSFDILREAGFDNINLDLMFGIPGQTLEIWEATLAEALALQSEHLSSYEVIYEEDTPLFEQMNAGEFDVDEELNGRLFEVLVERAAGAGLRQYEVANFARDHRPGHPLARPGAAPDVPHFACRHNVNYWRGGPYAAFGPSASGFEAGRRYRNVPSTLRYCERIEAGELPRDWEEELPARARAGEVAAFGLRMNAGWPWQAFHEATGFDLRTAWGPELAGLEARGWAVSDDRGFRLTGEGLRFADAAGAELLVEPAPTLGAGPAGAPRSAGGRGQGKGATAAGLLYTRNRGS